MRHQARQQFGFGIAAFLFVFLALPLVESLGASSAGKIRVFRKTTGDWTDGCPAINGASAGLTEIDQHSPAIDFNTISSSFLVVAAYVPQWIVSVMNSSGNVVGTVIGDDCSAEQVVLTITDPLADPKKPIRTYTQYRFQGVASGAGELACPRRVCFTWDGAKALNYTKDGPVIFGKENKQYGFVVTASTPQAGGQPLSIELRYPDEAQWPAIVDVMDIHLTSASYSGVGSFSSVRVHPINFDYYLSKSGYVVIDIFKNSVEDATCHTTVNAAQGTHTSGDTIHPVPLPTCAQFVRRIANNETRWGEDTTQGKNQNRDSWDGRGTNGSLVSSGTYIARIYAWDPDVPVGFGEAHDFHVSTLAVSLDPMQIADFTVGPLGPLSTSFATIGLLTTEPAEVTLDIWASSAVFANLNLQPPIQPSFCSLANCEDMLIRRIVTTTEGRAKALTVTWDGHDKIGKPMDDDTYVVTAWAQEKESGGATRIKTQKAKIGQIPIVRGLPQINQVQVGTTVLGSSPPVTALQPFFFNYAMGRDAPVNLIVIAPERQMIPKASGPGFEPCSLSTGCVIKTLVRNEIRQGFINLQEPIGGWDGRNDAGVRLSSGVYRAQLSVSDPLFPTRVSTMSALFPINMLRITDVRVSPLLEGSTDEATLTYGLTESMEVTWAIYKPSTTFTTLCPSIGAKFLGVGTSLPVRTLGGPRPGRKSLTEFWDGRDENGLFVPDGNYMSVLKATDTYGSCATDAVIREVPITRGQIKILEPKVTPSFPSVENSSDTLNIPLAPYEISYILSRDAKVAVTLRDSDGVFVSTIVNNEPRSGFIVNREFWDGTNFAGIRLTTASLQVTIIAEDNESIVTAVAQPTRLPISVDLLRVFDVAVTPLLPDSESAKVSYQLSESMTVDLRIYRPGTLFNLANEAVPSESESLVFKIQGARPGRVGITESWDC